MQEQIEIKQKISSIEHEIDSLKAMIIKLSQTKNKKKPLKLEGLLKGISVSEEDIEEAKKSLFRTSA